MRARLRAEAFVAEADLDPGDTPDHHGLHYEYLRGFNRPGRCSGTTYASCWPTA
jgi:hypothetical protein